MSESEQMSAAVDPAEQPIKCEEQQTNNEQTTAEQQSSETPTTTTEEVNNNNNGEDAQNSTEATAAASEVKTEGGTSSGAIEEPEQVRKVFVGGINYRTDEDTLKKHFSQYGNIVDCVIMRDPGGRSRGFAFVTFNSGETVDTVMKNRPHVVDGRDLDVKRATPKEDAGKPGFQLSVRKLFIGSVREGITEDDLKEYFGKFGNVTDCVVMKDSEGKHRGFGFVSFDDHDPVDKVIIQKNHSINGQVLDVKKALPKRRQTTTYSPYARGSGAGGFGMMDSGPSGWYEPSGMDGYGSGYPMSRGGSRYYGGAGGFAGGASAAGGYYGSPMRMRRGGGWHSDRSY